LFNCPSNTESLQVRPGPQNRTLGYGAIDAGFSQTIQVADWSQTWSQTCSELEFGLSRTI